MNGSNSHREDYGIEAILILSSNSVQQSGLQKGNVMPADNRDLKKMVINTNTHNVQRVISIELLVEQ